MKKNRFAVRVEWVNATIFKQCTADGGDGS